MALSHSWFPGDMDPEDKKQLELTIRNSRYLLGLLTNVIEQQIMELRTVKFSDYSDPGYSLKRADRDGQIRGLENILKMTKLEGITDQ